MTAVAGTHTFSVLDTFMSVMLLLVLRVLTRRTWIAVGLTTFLFFFIINPGQGNLLPFVIGFVFIASLHWFVLFRFGLLAVVVGSTVGDLFLNLPLTFDLTAWYAPTTLLVVALTLGLAGWGFWVALAGRPLFRDEILEAETARAR